MEETLGGLYILPLQPLALCLSQPRLDTSTITRILRCVHQWLTHTTAGVPKNWPPIPLLLFFFRVTKSWEPWMLAHWSIAEHELRGAKGLQVVVVEGWVGLGWVILTFTMSFNLWEIWVTVSTLQSRSSGLSKVPRVKQLISTGVKIWTQETPKLTRPLSLLQNEREDET